MNCPYCKNKLKIGVRLLFTGKCMNCNKKISEYNKRKYSICSAMNVVVSLIIFAVIRNYGNYFAINPIAFEIISFILVFLLLCVFELILLISLSKNIKNEK